MIRTLKFFCDTRLNFSFNELCIIIKLRGDILANDFENMATGTLKYSDATFTFVFDRNELRLIPSEEKSHEVARWFMTELSPGVYTIGPSVIMEEPYLIGKCNEGYEIIFFPIVGHPIRRYNSVLTIDIQAYIWKRFGCIKIDQIGFQSPELDCIFSCKNAIESYSVSKTGGYKVETKPFSETTTEKQSFVVDEIDVAVNFGVSMTTDGDHTKPPFSLHTEMYFEFPPTDDYGFVFRLCSIARGFIRYLCYRENVPFTTINLSAPLEGGKHIQFAQLYILSEQSETEPKCLKDERFIRHEYIYGFEGKILSDIAEGLLYIRNIPPTHKQGLVIDAARFVMITAAFEWEFRRLYPSGIKKRQRTLDAEKNAEETISKLCNKSKGKLKEIYKNLLNSVHFTQLASKINFTGKELGSIIDVFGKHLYAINGQELEYSKMGQRLGKQRNNYAHGNLDQEFLGLSLLDLMFLEMVVYAMQLKYYGINDLNIKKAINELFRQNIIIKDSE